MAQTMTLRAHGATRASDARLSSPGSSRASMYFMSPCLPFAIHAGKTRNSANSRMGAMPQRSNPAARADCLMRVGRLGCKGAVSRGPVWAGRTLYPPEEAITFAVANWAKAPGAPLVGWIGTGDAKLGS